MRAWGWILAGAAGAAAGTMATALVTGRSRAMTTLGPADPPRGLPPARVAALPGHGEVFYRDQPGPPGQPAVALLHGWVATADLNWFTNYAALEDLGRVLAPDHRGHGRGARHSQPFRLADVADDVAALLRAEQAAPAVLVGYSMGGPIAQLIWQRHPDVVAGMVLCATTSHFRFHRAVTIWWQLMTAYQFGSRLLPRSWLERALLAQLHGLLPTRLTGVDTDLASLAPLLPWLVGEIQRGDKEDLAEAGRELGRFDSRSWVGRVEVPTAVIITTRDRLVPASAQLELAHSLPNPLVLEVDADHDAPSARASAFNAALRTAVKHVGAMREERTDG